MRPKSIVLLVLALGCGLVSAIGINQVIASRDTNPQAPGETEAIFVALTEINMNDLVTPAMVKLEPWPKDKIPLGSVTKMDDLDNRRAITKLFPGEPLLDAKLLPKGASATSVGNSIPKGFRAVAVRVDDVASTGSMLLPGDRVDVIVHLPQGVAPGINEAVTRTFLRDVKVFAINDTTNRQSGAEGDGKITARSASLLVKPEQAQLLTLADGLGKIRLIMRNPGDNTADVVDDGTDVRELLGQLEKSNRDEENPVENNLLATLSEPTVVEPEPAPASGYTMTIIKGAEVEEVVLDPSSKVARMQDGTPYAAANDAFNFDETDDNEPDQANAGENDGNNDNGNNDNETNEDDTGENGNNDGKNAKNGKNDAGENGNDKHGAGDKTNNAGKNGNDKHANEKAGESESDG